MSDLGDNYRAMREAQKERRAERLPKRAAEILALADQGFSVECVTEYQYRINGRLDLYPTHNRYHDVLKNRRGGYRNATEFVKSFFK